MLAPNSKYDITKFQSEIGKLIKQTVYNINGKQYFNLKTFGIEQLPDNYAQLVQYPVNTKSNISKERIMVFLTHSKHQNTTSKAQLLLKGYYHILIKIIPHINQI